MNFYYFWVLLQHRLAYVSAVIVQLLLNFGFVILFQYYCIELYAIVSCKYYHHLKQNWWIKKFGSVFSSLEIFPLILVILPSYTIAQKSVPY